MRKHRATEGQRWEATAHANKHSPLTHAASASYSATPSPPPPWTSLHAVSHNKPLQVALARYFVAAKRKVTNKPIFSYSYLWYQNNNTIPMICPDLLTITCRMDLGNHPHFIEVSGHNSHKRGSNAHSCLTYHHHDTLTPALSGSVQSTLWQVSSQPISSTPRERQGFLSSPADS